MLHNLWGKPHLHFCRYGPKGVKDPSLRFFATTCLEYRDSIGVLVSKYGPQIVVALERFPLPDNADEMEDTARLKHAQKLIGSLGNQASPNVGAPKLKPKEVARRVQIGKLYHEFKYCRYLGSPSKRDQFLAAHPDCALSSGLMTKAVAAYKKQAKKQ